MSGSAERPMLIRLELLHDSLNLALDSFILLFKIVSLELAKTTSKCKEVCNISLPLVFVLFHETFHQGQDYAQ
jgi:hypothetical protein